MTNNVTNKPRAYNPPPVNKPVTKTPQPFSQSLDKQNPFAKTSDKSNSSKSDNVFSAEQPGNPNLQDKLHSVVGHVREMLSLSLKNSTGDVKKTPPVEQDQSDKADKGGKAHKNDGTSDQGIPVTASEGHSKGDAKKNPPVEKSNQANQPGKADKSEKADKPDKGGKAHKDDKASGQGIPVTASEEQKSSEKHGHGRAFGLSHNPHNSQNGQDPQGTAAGSQQGRKKQANPPQSAAPSLAELMKKMIDRRKPKASKVTVPPELQAIDNALDTQKQQRQAAGSAGGDPTGGGRTQPSRSRTWTSSLFDDVVRTYFNGSSPGDGPSDVAGLKFTRGF